MYVNMPSYLNEEHMNKFLSIRCARKDIERIVKVLRLLGAHEAPSFYPKPDSMDWILLKIDKKGLCMQGSVAPWICVDFPVIDLVKNEHIIIREFLSE